MAHAHVSANSDRKIGQPRWTTLCTAEASEWLVKTGFGVKNMRFGRTFYRWPGQKVAAVIMKPRTIAFSLHSISRDLVPFDIPVTFTIAPHDPLVDPDGFLRYAGRMNGLNEAEFHTILTGVIHGQTRILAGTLDVMEIFNGRDAFKLHVQEKVEKELIPWGLSVTNANISELRDMPGDDNKYFESLKQKAISGATQNARIEVAENKKRGDVGEKLRMGQAITETARIEAENQKAQNAQKAQIALSNKELELTKLECEMATNLKRKEAENAPKARGAVLQTDLNRLVGSQELSFLRATKFAQATVEAESAAKVAEGQAAARRAKADADLYATQQEANGALFRRQQEAKGMLAEAEAQAKGMLAQAEAQAEGLAKLLNTGDGDLIKFYLALERGLFTDMANSTASAVRGLSPKINIWTQGGGGGDAAAGGGDPMAPLKNLFTTLPPMLDAVATQTGVKMPSWMPQQPGEGAGVHQNGAYQAVLSASK